MTPGVPVPGVPIVSRPLCTVCKRFVAQERDLRTDTVPGPMCWARVVPGSDVACRERAAMMQPSGTTPGFAPWG